MFDRFRRSDWFVPAVASAVLHAALLILFVFIHLSNPPNENEHMTPSFRVKGIESLPVIPGKPGGGETRRFSDPSKKQEASGSRNVQLQDVPVDSLIKTSAPPKDEEAVRPDKIQIRESAIDSRVFETSLRRTTERQLKEKLVSRQQSTANAEIEKISTKNRGPNSQSLLQFLGKPLIGMGMEGAQNVGIDPEEGMPGFTPTGTGGGGGGGQGSGSPGGWADGIDAEPTEAIMKYGSLDDFLDIEVRTYKDPADGQNYYVITIFTKKNAPALRVMPKEIIFAIDSSLSISPHRLNEIKEGITKSLRRLNKDDVFNIMAFQDNASFFSPVSVKADPQMIKRAERFVMSLQPSNRTDVYAAMNQIVKTDPLRRPSSVMLISDGRPTHGIVNARELLNSITRLNAKVRPIFAFSGGAKVNRYVLDFIAYQNRGWSQFIKRTSDIDTGLAEFYDKIKDPIFLNLRYRLNGVNEGEVFPKSLPDFYRNAAFTLYGTYKDEQKFSMQLLGDVDGQTKELVFMRSLADAQKGDESIKKGYAFNRIYYLISRYTETKDASLLTQIDFLSRKYGITTPYSSDLEKID